MVVASEIACRLKKGSRELADRIKNLLELCGLPVRIQADIPVEKIMRAVCLDKKVRDRRLEFVLPLKPGEVVAGVAVDEKIIREVVDALHD